MVLVDTSVWVDHLHRKVVLLENLLDEEEVFAHPVVIGELACGGIPNRAETFRLLEGLPVATTSSNQEVLHLIETHKFYGKGISWGDAQILASALISGCALWTHDKKLHELAKSLGIAK